MGFWFRILVVVMFPVLVSGQGKRNAVDSIRTNEDLKGFLNRYYPKEEYIRSVAWTVEEYKPDEKTEVSIVREQCERFGGKPWFVTDLNSDGLSDLLLITRDLGVDCFIAEPDGRFILRGLARKDMFEFTLPRPVKIGGKDAVVLQRYNDIFSILNHSFNARKARPWKQDTVIFRYGEFLNYNPNPVKEKIEKISLSMNYGVCMADFLMILDSDGKVRLSGDPFAYETMWDTPVDEGMEDSVFYKRREVFHKLCQSF